MTAITLTWLPWLLSAITVIAMMMTGRGMRSGWAVGIVSQILWLVWIAISGNTGFVVLTTTLLIVYADNWRQGEKIEGWVIANAQGTAYRAWDSCGPKWVDSIDRAIVFARRSDAEQSAEGDEDAWRILKRKVEA